MYVGKEHNYLFIDMIYAIYYIQLNVTAYKPVIFSTSFCHVKN